MQLYTPMFVKRAYIFQTDDLKYKAIEEKQLHCKMSWSGQTKQSNQKFLSGLAVYDHLNSLFGNMQ